MRPLTGEDELACTAGPGPATRLAALLARLGAVAEPRALSLPDWEAALLDLRASVVGPKVEARVDCAACGAGAMLEFDSAALPREAPPLPAAPLPLHPLCAGDLIDLEALPGAAGGLAFLLARAARCPLPEAAAALDAPGGAAVTAALETLAAGLGIELATACPVCGAAVTAPFDVAAFLDAELQARAGRLLDEVHLIASAYHWAEAAILALPVERRQAYLARILAAQAVPDLGSGHLAGVVGLGAVA